MVKAFLTPVPESTSNSAAEATVTSEATGEAGREKVRIVVRGSSYGVQRVIHELYRVGFAEVIEWSKPQLTGQVNEVMRILTRYVFTE